MKLLDILKKINRKRIKLYTYIKGVKWIIFNLHSFRKELADIELTPFLLKEWKHKDIYYFKGILNDKKVFIKYVKNQEILLNEWEIYNRLKKTKNFKEEYFIKYLEYRKVRDGEIILSEFILEEKNENFLEQRKLEVLRQCEEILDILYEAKIIHRDIKEDNISATRFTVKSCNMLKVA